MKPVTLVNARSPVSVAGCDVCIVGGGPAGLITALALRREGCLVTVLDCAVPPIDKACGEGLMPDSVEVLRQIGVEMPAGQGHTFRGIQFHDGASTVAADFAGAPAWGLRRTALHALLVRHAELAQIPMIWNAKHVQLTSAGVHCNGRLLEAQLVIGADGQNSSIRRNAGLSAVIHERRRYGFRRHYRIAPWSPYVEVYWGDHCQLYVTPVAANEIGVASISRDPALRLQGALAQFPHLAARLASATAVTEERGSLSVSRRLRRVQRDGVALVGDASGSVDAITGEGLGVSFRQALALARAVAKGQIDEYEHQHRKLMRRSRAMAALLLALDGRNGLRRRVLAGLSQQPEFFRSLLAIHVGESSFRDVWSWNLLGFSRSFLTA